LRTGIKNLRDELANHFKDPQPPDDIFAKKMRRFEAEATEKISDLMVQVELAESTFSDVIKHYGEDEKSMNSSEFYGIFKTFVTSYKVSKLRFLHESR